MQITNYLDVEDAKIKETEYLNMYKNNNWKILNKVKTGSIGSNIIKWSIENCKIEALKYETRSKYQKGSKGSYLSAYRNGWLDDICKHMKDGKRKNGFWNNYNICKEYANKCRNKTEYQRKYYMAYYYSRNNNWIEDFF